MPGDAKALAVLLALTSMAPMPATANRTRLLEVDLRTGQQRRIDQAGRPTTAADRQLDAMLGSAMGKSFSTDDLARISAALRRYIAAARPRASARLLLFLYPGRVTSAGLKDLREVLVEIDLVVDPCSRSVCRDAVGKHLELIGRSLKQAEIRTRSYKIRFKTVTVRAVMQVGATEHEQYRLTAEEVVQVGRDGGGSRLVQALDRQRGDYDRSMYKAISRQLALRRLQLARPVSVSRARRSVSVQIELRSDRARFETHVGDAFAAATRALRSSPHTPADGQLTVVALIPQRGVGRRVFRSTTQPWGLYLDGRLTRQQLWSTYVVQQRKDGQQLTFDDDEARGSAPERDPGPDRTAEILGASFSRLAPCLQAEAGRNRRFGGATLLFAVSAEGRATGLRLKERGASPRLHRCLEQALARIRFQRHGGPPRQVSYPMYIQR